MKGRIPWNKGMIGISGTPHTEETKKRMSAIKKKWHSEIKGKSQ